MSVDDKGVFRVVVLGRGYLGSGFCRVLSRQPGVSLVTLDRNDIEIGRNMSLAWLGRRLSRIADCDVVVNCIAKADTSWCEDPRNWGVV